MSTYKSLVMAKKLKDIMTILLPSTWVITDGFDASGNPTLTMQQDSSWAAAEQKAFVRIKHVPVDANAKDGLGLSQREFTPHVVQVVVEASATATISVMQTKFLVPILGECLKLGSTLEVYHSANTNDPDVADITGAPQVTFEPDIYFKQISGQ